MFIARSVMTASRPSTAVGPPTRIHWAFTDATGVWETAGDAAAPAGQEGTHYGNFNLGSHVGDDPHAVGSHREELVRSLGVTPHGVVYMNQVHGNDVAVVDGPWATERPADADAMVTTRPGLGLAVLVADCVPVVLGDPVAGVVGVAHAGRKGMLSGVVGRAVGRMCELGAADITAVIGPSICGACYEVPEEMAEEAARARPASAARTREGTPAIDVASGVEAELTALDVRVHRVPGCTLEDERLYSYRRHRRTGRFAGVVVLEAERAQDRREDA